MSRSYVSALLALAAVVGTLYYVGLGVQNSGGDPAPPSEEEDAGNPDPQAGGGEAPQGGEEPAGGQQPGGPQDRERPDAASQPEPDSLTVEVSVEGAPSWLSILADGDLAYEQIAQPGFSQSFEAQREISIRTGNAGAVGVEVNGQDLGKLGESGEVLTRAFTLKSAT